jgi:hypothetical protein
MSVSELRLYDLLRNKLGEKEAETFMEVLEETVQKKIDLIRTNLATKEDLHQTKIELIKWVFAFWITLILMIAGLYIKK